MALTYNETRGDTIAAIATGITESGIGIIRISGPDAFSVCDRIFRNSRGEKVSAGKWKAATLHFGFIVDPERNEEKIDEVLVSIMKAPHSYTTEDTIEINTHGGVYVMHRVLDVVLSEGARLADPGEFTKRAFLGGRIDLSRAEAVMDLISSQNEFARKTSLEQLEGSVSSRIRKLREQIVYEIAFIESALDDPENYSLDGYPEKLREKCSVLISELDSMLEYSRNGRILKDGIRTAIVGKPNAGKSSLLNRLAGEERAIVTDVAGTTRDTLEEKVKLDGLVLDLIDTAGIHQTEDKVEKIGIERARKAMDSADLILFVMDGSETVTEEDREIADRIERELSEGKKCIVLVNKSDLEGKTGISDAESLFQKTDGANLKFLSVSMISGKGLDRLVMVLKEMFRTGEIVSSNEVFLSDVREQNEAESARNSLQLVIQSIDSGLSEDFFSIDLMNAYTSLGRIIGESVEDDLVEEIFSKFCLGK